MLDSSNKVFQQIQSANTDSPFGKGIILFANDQTGAPVEMHPKVREVLTSEDLFIGNNPLIQLQKAFERLESGPWYIDCRGDVLYIHNRTYNTPPVHNYIYDRDNGEVLSISFKTQYRTKNAPRAATLSFDGFKKTLNVSSTGLSIGSDQEIADRANQINMEERGGTLTEVPSEDYLSPTITNPAYYENKLIGQGHTPSSIQAETDLEFNALQREDYESLRGNLQDYGTYNNLVQSYLNSKGITQGSQAGRYIDQKLKDLQDDPEQLDNFLRENFSGDTFTVVNDLYRPFIRTTSLEDLIGNNVYIPAYSTDHNRTIGQSYVFKGGGVSPIPNADLGYSIFKFLQQRNYVVVGSQGGISYDRHQYAGFYKLDNIQVTTATKKKGNYVLNGYRIMSDYVSRTLNSPEGKYNKYLLNHALNNSTRKITEARLEIEMRVVGRPSLTTSSKIHIDNVGSRSGDYIIKTCIHRLSSDGYTCSLTLVRGDYKIGASSDTLSIDVGKSSGNKEGNNKNQSPTPNKPVPTTNFNVVPTQEEIEYFNKFSGNIDQQTNIAVEITWHRYQAWKNGNLDSAQGRGVYHKHINADSNGNVLKTTWTATPAPHVDNFEQFKTAYSKEYYKLIRKKASDYKRYGKK